MPQRADTQQELENLKETLDSSVIEWAQIINSKRAERSGQDRDARLEPMARQFHATATELIEYFSKLEIQPETTLLQFQLDIVDIVEQELAVISLPLIQRLAVVAKQQRGSYAQRLAEADIWARYFYSAYTHSDKTNISPIIYFDTSAAIRRFFLTEYPLIAMRFRSFAEAMEWEALAHEVGHFVFHNVDQLAEKHEILRTLRDRITGTLLNQRRMLLESTPALGAYTVFHAFDAMVEQWVSWVEEVFADICGALFAGPSYADSARALVALRGDADLNLLLIDDGEHPMLYLRPFIALEALAYVVDRKKKTADPQIAYLQGFVEGRREQWEAEIITKIRQATVKDEVSELQFKLMQRSISVVAQCLLDDIGPASRQSAQSTTTRSKDNYTVNIPGLYSLIDSTRMLKLFSNTPPLPKRVRMPEKPPEVGVSNHIDPQAGSIFKKVLKQLQQNRQLQGDEEIAQALLRLARINTDLQISGVAAGIQGEFVLDNNGPWTTDGRQNTRGLTIFWMATANSTTPRYSRI